MSEQLNVLVLESDHGAADVARRDLEEAGHNVLRCHEPGHAAFPCNALNGEGCPLESTPVDVTLDVRLHARTQPTPLEDGVRCAIQQHVPLVVAGPNVLDPFAEFATVSVAREDDLVGAVERAARAPLAEHSEAAARAVREVLDRRELRTVARIEVHRRHGSLLVDISGLSGLDQATKDVAAVRIVAALRALDSHARGIDVRYVE